VNYEFAMRVFEFWENRDSCGAWEIAGDPTERFHSLNQSEAVLLYRESFENYEQFKKFYEDFFFHGLKEKLALLNIPASEFLLYEYPCGLQPGDTVVLESGFTQNIGGRHNDFIKKVGWKFSVVPGDKDYPNVVWLKTHKSGYQQKYFPILEASRKKFKKITPEKRESEIS
jgi:hypothetical protein